MAAQTNTQTVALQLEKVRSKLPLLYERDDTFLNLIQKRGDIERVSSRSMRVPLQMRPGGKVQQRTMSGDDLGRGSGTDYQVATLTPIFFVWATEINKLVEYATNAPEKAVQNAARREVKQAMAQFRKFLDSMLQTSGDGVIGEVLSEASGVITCATPMLANLVYYNQDVQIFDSTLSTDRGSSEITAVDKDAGTFTLASVPAGTIATDKVVIEGVGTSPTSLFGLKYHHSSASTGTWMALNRATFPEIRTPQVAAGSASLTTTFIRLALNKIRKALGEAKVRQEQFIAHLNVEQEDAYEQLGILISNIIKQGSSNQKLDLFFGQNNTMSGVPMYPNIHADPERIDFVALSHWGRAVMQDIDFYEVDGRTVHPVYGASGGLAAAYLFYLVVGMQIFNDAPRCGSYIDGLLKPAGY